MAGPISKNELQTLETIVRDSKRAKFTIDDPNVSSLTQRGMVRTKLGKTEATPRGKMAVQRSTSLGRGKRGGRSGGLVD